MEQTPVSADGITIWDQLTPEEAVVRAWTDPGKHPSWHHRMQQVVFKQMPVLARALDRLAKKDEPCPTCSGENRETVGMVCQTCGVDYASKLDIHYLLHNSCPAIVLDDGFNVYKIETHCMTFTVRARHIGRGKYQIEAFTSNIK